jgi:hypothetical protein
MELPFLISQPYVYVVGGSIQKLLSKRHFDSLQSDLVLFERPDPSTRTHTPYINICHRSKVITVTAGISHYRRLRMRVATDYVSQI